MTRIERNQISRWNLVSESEYNKLVKPEWNMDTGIVTLRCKLVESIEKGSLNIRDLIDIIGASQEFVVNNIQCPEKVEGQDELGSLVGHWIRSGRLGHRDRNKVQMFWEHEKAHRDKSLGLGVKGHIVFGTSDGWLIGIFLLKLDDILARIENVAELSYMLGSIMAAPETTDTWHYEEEDKLAARLLLVARNGGVILSGNENRLVKKLGYRR